MTPCATFPPLRALAIVGLTIQAGRSLPVFARGADPELPLMVEAKMPIYPIRARAARIQGAVKIRVTTDGEAVAALAIESGPPMLAKFTEDNIRSWRFAKHEPTTFVTTFNYEIEGPDRCTYTNDLAALNLPLEARIKAKGIMTCDPAAEGRR